MPTVSEALSAYVVETRRLDAIPSVTEPSFYPDLRQLLTAVLKSERLPFDAITSTSESSGMPDFRLGDSALFVAVYGEVKRANVA